MNQPLGLEYACTPEELKEAQRLHVISQVGQGSKLRAIAVLLIGFVLLAALLTAKFMALAQAARPYVFGIAALVVALLFVAQLFRRKGETKQADEDQKCLVEITPHEVRLAGDNGWAIAPWSGFGKLVESETLFVLPDATGYQLLVFPKRIFADDTARDWFRKQAQQAGAAMSLQSEELQEKSLPESLVGGVRAQVRLGFFDYVDRSFASWKSRGIAMFINALIVGTFVWAMLNPPPNPKVSAAAVFFFFCLPFLIVLNLVIFFVAAVHAWMHHRRFLQLQVIELSEAGISFSLSNGRGTAEWSNAVQYKETPWSFFLWWNNGDVWLQLPKRSFTTHDGVDRCRQILAKHATQTTWYFG